MADVDRATRLSPATPVTPPPGPAESPAVAPPPWALRGHAVAVLLRSRRPVRGRGLAGRLSAVAFVDYATSAVGPYRELLHVPRVERWADVIGPTVAGIWVTSEASAVSGNHNWGLTKRVAEIEHQRIGSGRPEHWGAVDAAGPLGELTHRPWGPALPVGKPRAGGRLLQRRDGRAWATPVSVFGLLRPTSVWDLWLDPERLPDMDEHRIVAAVSIRAGRMTFHPATIRHTD